MSRGRSPSRAALPNPTPADDGLLGVEDDLLDIEERLLRKALRFSLTRRPRSPRVLHNWLVNVITEALDWSEVGTAWSGLVRYRPNHQLHLWQQKPGRRIVCGDGIPDPRWDRDPVEECLTRSWGHERSTYLDYLVEMLTSQSSKKKGALARATATVFAALLHQPPPSMLYRLDGFRDTRVGRRPKGIAERVHAPHQERFQPSPQAIGPALTGLPRYLGGRAAYPALSPSRQDPCTVHPKHHCVTPVGSFRTSSWRSRRPPARTRSRSSIAPNWPTSSRPPSAPSRGSPPSSC